MPESTSDEEARRPPRNVMEGGGAALPTSANDGRPSYPIESVDNALRILLMLRNHSVIRVKDVSDALKVAPSTAHRLLAMLAYRDFVRHDQVSHAYVPGPALFDLGKITVPDADLRIIVQPHLEALSRRFDETAHLSVLVGNEVTFLSCVEGSKAMRVASRVGMRLPAHCTSVGKAMLAELSTERLRRLYSSQELRGLTQRSIRSRDQLEEALEQVRSRGYATNAGESEEGVSSVAVAIWRDEHAIMAALNVSAPAPRLPTRLASEAADAMMGIAARIRTQLPNGVGSFDDPVC